MNEQPTIKITEEKLILRDFLAADRTALANERTFLAYIRTAFTFILAGITLFKFFNTFAMQLVGGICIFIGLTILVWGLDRYNHVQINIRKARGEAVRETTSISFINFRGMKSYLFAHIRNHN